MIKGEIITYRARKYKVFKITKQKKKHPNRTITIFRAYLKPYGWNGVNRIGIIKKGKISELEKARSWVNGKEYYKSWS